MMISVIARRLIATLLFTGLFLFTQVQASVNAINKPYRILTSGKQITVKSSINITSLMVWTATGHRIVEQKSINAPSYSFRVGGSNDKVYFMMLELKGERRYTEKIGVQ